ncbi:MAG TPA: GNAT family N-acetyltransferase [Candidatus Limnocylindrales bacterium]|nr:GNAT family N-acetyltransferase [Candidatus Limnocylindrales bacterium]
MEALHGVRIRPAVEADMFAAFTVFRRSLSPMLFRLGSVPSPEITDAELAESWGPRKAWIEHLWKTAAENWVAVSGTGGSGGVPGEVVGWAMSVQRGPLLELTHFFVLPGSQSRGVGRALLDRAFPIGRGPHRAIIATQDPRATSRYLRQGVRFISTIGEFEKAPTRIEPSTDLVFDTLDRSPNSVALVESVQEQLIGHRREVDIDFLLSRQPAWVARRSGVPVAFAFGHSNEICGPIGVLDSADLPAVLDHVENHAAEIGATNLYFSTPLRNHGAVEHLLARGYTIDPFFTSFLADSDWLPVDRWIHTGISYIF